MAERPDPSENTPLGPAAVACGDNMELARVIGNMVLEAQATRTGLHTLYNQLCSMTSTPPKSWGYGLVEQYEQHVARIQAILPTLKTAVG